LTFPYTIVHARTYVGGLIGYGLSRLLRTRFIFHNEGFYPDEQVDGGVWRGGSLPPPGGGGLGQRMYAPAHRVHAPSHRARRAIEQIPAVRRKGTPTVVVPSCVDLDQFRGDRTPRPRDCLRLVYIGTVGNRYLFNEVARFVAVVAQELGPTVLRVLTRA